MILVFDYGFRLLNSEIGNDRMLNLNELKAERIRFRLLNSEIGNDLAILSDCRVIDFSFRLLNSEIGNDQKQQTRSITFKAKFSSP